MEDELYGPLKSFKISVSLAWLAHLNNLSDKTESLVTSWEIK